MQRGFILKKIVAIFAVLSASVQPAYAVDWCKTLMCMSHPENYNNAAECAAEVPQAFATAKAQQSWGTCPTSGDDTQVKVNNWQIRRDKHGNITSVNGTASVYNNGELKHQYPF